jgi:hypothetical protein
MSDTNDKHEPAEPWVRSDVIVAENGLHVEVKFIDGNDEEVMNVWSKWDGCVNINHAFNGEFTAHVCDIDEFISRLVEAREAARLNMPEHVEYWDQRPMKLVIG